MIKKEFSVIMPYWKVDEVLYALNFIVKSNASIIDIKTKQDLSETLAYGYFIAMDISITGTTAKVIDRIYNALLAEKDVKAPGK